MEVLLDGDSHVMLVPLDEKINCKIRRRHEVVEAEVCKGLPEDMARRGLDTGKDYLFVLDGAKALRSAVARVFGTKAMVQRCQAHKRRNVLKHLPETHQNAVDARISAAYKMSDYDDAWESLDLTVRYLEKINHDAAESLKERLEETLTIHKLGITGLLRKSLATTNPLESCFSGVRTSTGRSKGGGVATWPKDGLWPPS